MNFDRVSEIDFDHFDLDHFDHTECLFLISVDSLCLFPDLVDNLFTEQVDILPDYVDIVPGFVDSVPGFVDIFLISLTFS